MKIALNLSNLSEAQTVTLAGTIITGLTDTPSVTPKPTLPAMTTLRGAAQERLDELAAAKQALLEAGTAKDNALEALRDALRQQADNVEQFVAALPDAQALALIESVGMKAQSAPTRLTELPAVTGLSLTAGDAPGELDWHCDAMARVSFFVVEYTLDPVSPAAHWVSTRPSTKSSGTLTGLPSGASASMRVHAEGTRGVAGAPATAGPKIVP